MNDELYTKATSDLGNLCLALIAKELFTPEFVAGKLAAARDLLQAGSATAARAVPDGMQAQYQAAVGVAHDRAVALFQEVLEV